MQALVAKRKEVRIVLTPQQKTKSKAAMRRQYSVHSRVYDCLDGWAVLFLLLLAALTLQCKY